MTHPTIKSYREDRRNHYISPLSDRPQFLGQSSLDLRWNKYDTQVNLSKDDELLKLEVLLPGFNKEEIEIIVTDQLLTVRAERQRDISKNTQWLIKEFDTDIVIKRFELKNNIGHEKITADYKNGILTLTFVDVPPNRELPYKNITVQ